MDRGSHRVVRDVNRLLAASLTLGAPGPSGSGVEVPAGAATVPTVVTVPATINADCSVNVSAKLQHWLANLAPSSTVNATGDCFLINEGHPPGRPAGVGTQRRHVEGRGGPEEGRAAR